jgi:anthranilate phosphoribosyltransferase
MPAPTRPNALPVDGNDIQRALDSLRRGADLDDALAEATFRRVIAGESVDTEIVALLDGLRTKGETAAEIAGVVRALRASMLRVAHATPEGLVDTCGTGGGRITTVNISTAAAFVAAGAGVTVAKHGNRSFTSRSGSADVLEALGLAIDLSPARASTVLAEHGIVFLFAPTYHAGMRHVASARRQLGVATIMNLVGPLANPASAGRQVVGVADAARGGVMADALRRLGTVHGLVVHGEIGLDEISPMGESTIWEVTDAGVRQWRLDPADFELATPSLDGLAGGEPADNAATIEQLLSQPSVAAPALRSAVVLNAAAAIHVSGLTRSFGEAVEAAIAALNDGRAHARVLALRTLRADG